MSHSVHITAYILFLGCLKHSFMFLAVLRVELALHDSAHIYGFVFEDYIAFACEHFLQSASLREFSIPCVFCDFSSCEFYIDCSHFSNPFDSQ